MILTATWTPITYTITYDLMGGLGTELPTSYTVEDSISLPRLTHDTAGYVFDGWLRGGDTTPTLDTVIPQGTTGDLTFTVAWAVISLGQAVDNGTVVKQFSPDMQLWNPTTNDYRIGSSAFYIQEKSYQNSCNPFPAADTPPFCRLYQ